MHWLILSFNPHFFKLQYVNKFWCSFSQILMEHVPTHNFPVKKRHNFSRVKYGRTFSKKIFSWQWNRLYGERVVLHWRNNDQNMPRELVTNAFSSNLNLLNPNIFPNHWGILTWRKNSDQSIELLKELPLRLVIIKRFQRSRHHQFYSFDPDLQILFEKSTSQIWVSFEKYPLQTMHQVLRISCKACFLFS